MKSFQVLCSGANCKTEINDLNSVLCPNCSSDFYVAKMQKWELRGVRFEYLSPGLKVSRKL